MRSEPLKRAKEMRAKPNNWNAGYNPLEANDFHRDEQQELPNRFRRQSHSLSPPISPTAISTHQSLGTSPRFSRKPDANAFRLI
jgi:hypothetical protein